MSSWLGGGVGECVKRSAPLGLMREMIKFALFQQGLQLRMV